MDGAQEMSRAPRLGNRKALTLTPCRPRRRREPGVECIRLVPTEPCDALMDWFRAYASESQHPEMQALSHAAFRLWHDARCYIAQTESDGFIPTTQIPRCGPHGTAANCRRLVEAGLWEESPTGFIDVRWEHEQESHAEMEKRRAKTADRVRKHRRNRGSDDVGSEVGNAVTDPVTNGVGNGVGNSPRGREREESEREVEVEAVTDPQLRAVNS